MRGEAVSLNIQACLPCKGARKRCRISILKAFWRRSAFCFKLKIDDGVFLRWHKELDKWAEIAYSKLILTDIKIMQWFVRLKGKRVNVAVTFLPRIPCKIVGVLETIYWDGGTKYEWFSSNQLWQWMWMWEKLWLWKKLWLRKKLRWLQQHHLDPADPVLLRRQWRRLRLWWQQLVWWWR